MKACDIRLELEDVCSKVRPSLAEKVWYSVGLIRKSEKMALRLDPENGFLQYLFRRKRQSGLVPPCEDSWSESPNSHEPYQR